MVQQTNLDVMKKLLELIVICLGIVSASVCAVLLAHYAAIII